MGLYLRMGLILGYLCVIAANGTALALLSRALLPGVFDVGYLYSVAGWTCTPVNWAMMTCAFLFFGYMNFRGMDFASSIQLILAFALVAGVLILTVGSFSTSTASLDNLFPLFAEAVRRGLRHLHRSDHPLVVRRLRYHSPDR